MARRRVAHYLAVAAAFGCAACSLLVDVNGLSGGPDLDPAPPADAGPDHATDARESGADADGGVDADAGHDATLEADAPLDSEAAADAAPLNIAFVSKSLAAPLMNVSSLDLSTPPGVVSGDVILVGLFTDLASSTATTPAGFTKLDDVPSGTDTHGWYYMHVAGNSEPSKTTFTFSSTPYASAIAVAYRNVRAVNPIDVASYGSSPGNPLTSAAVTTTVANTMLVVIDLADDTVTANWFAPTGMTLRGQTGITAAFDAPFATPGSTGAQLATNDKNVGAVTSLIALAPK